MSSKTKNRFEDQMLRSLKRRRNVTSVLYEPTKLDYILYRKYTPDFVVSLSNGTSFILETKGYFRRDDMSKLLAVKKCNPELDIRIVFYRDDPIKGTKMKYSDWANKYGFPFAIESPPKEWFNVE